MAAPNRSAAAMGILLCLCASAGAHEKPNAADLYKKACDKVGELRETAIHALHEEGDDGVRKLSEAQTRLVAATHGIADLLEEAKAIDHCEWDESFFKDPIKFELSPWLGRSRTVSHITILRARHLLHQGKAKEAVNELLAAFRMSRQLGRNCTVISKIIQIANDVMLVDALARLAPLIPAELRRELPARLDATIKADTMKQAMDRERKATVAFFRTQFPRDPQKHGEAWVAAQEEMHKVTKSSKDDEPEFDPKPYLDIAKLAKDDPKKYAALIDEYDKACADLLATYDAPSDQVMAKYDAWKKGANTANVLIRELATDSMGIIRRLPLMERRPAVHLAMFRAAIAYLDDGEAALDKHRVPGTNEKFELVKEKAGFELRYRLQGEEMPLAVRIMIAR